MSTPLLILGAGPFAEEVADLAADAGFEVIAFIEGMDREKCGRELLGRPVVWVEDAKNFDAAAVCAVGSPKRLQFIGQAGVRFTTLVHPGARVSRTAMLGAGTIISAGAIIAAHAQLAAHVIVNRGALIGHHAQFGECATIGPGANMAGRTRLGAGVQVGMGAIVLDGISIGDGSIVGAGALVTKDVPAKVQVVGLPARVVKELA